MTRPGFQRYLLARATAWLLIFVCAWMGTEGVLHHTDGEAFPHAASGLHRVTAAAPADSCAACQWTQGLQAGTVALWHVPSPSFIVRPRLTIAAQSALRLIPHLRSPRAPPASQTNC